MDRVDPAGSIRGLESRNIPAGISRSARLLCGRLRLRIRPGGIRRAGRRRTNRPADRQGGIRRADLRVADRRAAIVRRAGGRIGLPIPGHPTIGAGAGIIPIIAITIILTGHIDGDRPGIPSAFSCQRWQRVPSSSHTTISTTGMRLGCIINRWMEVLGS